jgi:hypothetical protein
MSSADIGSFEDFAAQARRAGFDQVLVRRWEPGTTLAEHAHEFDAEALVIQGQMWLSCGGQTRELVAGDRFELARGTVHAERYGPQGATYWVARRGVGRRAVAPQAGAADAGA